MLAAPVLVLLVAVGCADPVAEPSQPIAASTASAVSLTTTSASAAVDAAYLATIATRRGVTGDAERELRRAHALCDLLRGGTSSHNAVLALRANGFAPGDAGFVLGAAVAAYCPEYTDDVT